MITTHYYQRRERCFNKRCRWLNVQNKLNVRNRHYEFSLFIELKLNHTILFEIYKSVINDGYSNKSH